jgi:DNA invertase Pin-like site-specific DNA recombinase
MRAVIYARFSTDLQDERSIADQVALCREYAQRQGHAVTAIYEDASASGSSLHGRPAIMRLLAEAARGSFDLMLAESMSRVGRDQEDRAAIRKRLSFHGIAIATPTDGVVTPLLIFIARWPWITSPLLVVKAQRSCAGCETPREARSIQLML